MAIRDLWYNNAVIYALDIESFQDGNGDGIGDFAGLTRRLAYLAGLGIWDEATRAAVEGEITEQIDAAVAAAGELPAAKATEVFDNVYGDPPRRLLRQREELLRLIPKAYRDYFPGKDACVNGHFYLHDGGAWSFFKAGLLDE